METRDHFGNLIARYREQAYWTQRDLAANSQVDHTTVGRAEKYGKPGPDVANRLVTALDKILTFTPQQLRQLADTYLLRGHLHEETSPSRLLGLVVPRVGYDSFWSGLTAAVEEEATQAGFGVILRLHHNDPNREDNHLSFLADVDALTGIILAPAHHGIDYGDQRLLRRHVASYRNRKIPLVFIDRRELPDTPIPFVGIDNRIVARRAVERLTDAGHRAVAIILGDTNSRVQEARFLGYRDALDLGGIAYDERLVRWGADVAPQDRHFYGYNMARLNAYKLLREEHPSAIFCTSWEIAREALQAIADIRSEGTLIEIPRDLSVISFDDTPELDLLTPGITRVKFQMEEYARRSVRKLRRMLSEPDSNAEYSDEWLESWEILDRGSIQPPNVAPTTS